MKQARYFGLAALFITFLALAGPRPRATVTVTGNSTVVTHAATERASLLMQCPGGMVRYRTFTSDELAAQDGGAQSDGGVFGVLADFTQQGDPVGILMAVNQVAVGLLGTDAGATISCEFSTP